MFKRIDWNRILIACAWIISISGLVVLMSFISEKESGLVCKRVKIFIPGTYSFIEKSEVNRILRTSEQPLVGRPLDKINIHAIEGLLRANPFIEKAKVFADMDGVVNIEIKQREPVLRVLNYVNQDFYIDRNGYKIPTSMNFTARTLVANGFIMESFANRLDTLKTKLAKDLYKTAVFIEQDTLWSKQIEQLYVNQQNEIEMIPRVGDHKIILGDADSIEHKFRNLLVFYKKALPRVGWSSYKTINIKFAGQVVCERVDSLDTIRRSQLQAAAPATKDKSEKFQDTSNIDRH